MIKKYIVQEVLLLAVLTSLYVGYPYFVSWVKDKFDQHLGTQVISLQTDIKNLQAEVKASRDSIQTLRSSVDSSAGDVKRVDVKLAAQSAQIAKWRTTVDSLAEARSKQEIKNYGKITNFNAFVDSVLSVDQ